MKGKPHHPVPDTWKLHGAAGAHIEHSPADGTQGAPARALAVLRKLEFGRMPLPKDLR